MQATVDLNLYRQKIRLTAGNHAGTVYAETTGRIVNICPTDPRPYGCRLDGAPAWDINWFDRDAFEVLS